ncbi:hypothetical protein ACOBR2_21245 (plasmid) [Telmatobacter bradus]|uniref:hypothetical protein n=1 Tax=Telmatobacter bradus TaxID=474953 RepID=UPI003B43857A
MYGGFSWAPYVSVAERRLNALRKQESLRQKGQQVSPVNIEGRAIAKTFWGKAWCDNLESYSDYENRLPRGRTYVRNGSVLDLQIAPGQIKALVSGSIIYKVEVKVHPVAQPRWQSICTDCAGSIDSLVELLQGKLSKGVMERICQQQSGLFPSPKEIELACNCPDWAEMCKHIAAVLYGVGARLDQQPELLFRLREVDEKELLASAGKSLSSAKKTPSSAKILDGEDLSKLFGLDMAEPDSALPTKTVRAKTVRTKTVRVKTVRTKDAQVQAVPAKKSKPANAKTKPRQKAAKAVGKKVSAASAKGTAKKKSVAAPAKSQSAKTAAPRKAAGNSTAKRATSTRKSSVATKKKKIAVVAEKAKPTRKTQTVRF